jgi:hypothetical protein
MAQRSDAGGVSLLVARIGLGAGFLLFGLMLAIAVLADPRPIGWLALLCWVGAAVLAQVAVAGYFGLLDRGVVGAGRTRARSAFGWAAGTLALVVATGVCIAVA